MVATIDKFGRLLIPKTIRDQMELSAGSEVELVPSGKSLCVRALAGHQRVVERNGLPCIEGVVLEGNVDIVDFIRQQRIIRQP